MKKGFTLIEVVISILVLSVSTLVVISMQTSTLRGYSSIRDNDDAVMIAHRTADLLHVDAISWRADTTPPTNWSFENNPSYQGTFRPFDADGNPLATMRMTPWTWIPLFAEPVDARMANSGQNTGRHCVYVRGGPFAGGLDTVVDGMGTITASSAMVIHIAVVSTGIRNRMSDCVTTTNNSPAFSIDDLEFVSGDEVPLGQRLELDGYRPTYHATMVFQRDFL